MSKRLWGWPSLGTFLDSSSHIAFCLLNMATRFCGAKCNERVPVMTSDACSVQLRAGAGGTGTNRDTARERHTRVPEPCTLARNEGGCPGPVFWRSRWLGCPGGPPSETSISQLFPNIRGEQTLDPLATPSSVRVNIFVFVLI